MQNLRCAFLIVLILCPILSWAKKSNNSTAFEHSQFFYQAQQGEHILIPSLVPLQSGKYDLDGSVFDSKIVGNSFAIGYQYGLAKNLAVGVSLSYAKTTFESLGPSRTSSGMQNIDTYFLGSYSLESGSLKYGTKLSISPGNLIIEPNGNSNGYKGRHILTPYLGFESPLSSGIYGLKFEHEIGLGKRTYKTNMGTFKDSGMEVTTLSVFYEQELEPRQILGASFAWSQIADYVNDNGSFANITPLHNLSIYANHPIGLGTLITKLGYTFTSDKDLDGVKINSNTQYDLSIGFRFSL